MAQESQNPFLSMQKSDLHVALHPLPLLNISDYITRHTLRQQEGAIVGALLGQQNGQEITVEHAFECRVEGNDLDDEWFTVRLQQSESSPIWNTYTLC
jgi:COP9 signalosome complex subunit 6